MNSGFLLYLPYLLVTLSPSSSCSSSFDARVKPRTSCLVEKRSFPEPHPKPDIPHCDTPRIPHFPDNTCKLPSALRTQCSALPSTHNLKHFPSFSHTFQTSASSRRVAFRSQELMASATSILNLGMAKFISFACGYQRRGIPIVLKINLKHLAFLRLGMVALPMTPEPGAGAG